MDGTDNPEKSKILAVYSCLPRTTQEDSVKVPPSVQECLAIKQIKNKSPKCKFKFCYKDEETDDITSFLRSNDEELGKPVTCLLFGPDVLVSLVITRVLNQVINNNNK